MCRVAIFDFVINVYMEKFEILHHKFMLGAIAEALQNFRPRNNNPLLNIPGTVGAQGKQHKHISIPMLTHRVSTAHLYSVKVLCGSAVLGTVSTIDAPYLS